jgi:hypothetical protein
MKYVSYDNVAWNLIKKVKDVHLNVLKIQLSHFKPWRHMGGVEVQLQSFLKPTLDECESSASRLNRFIPGESAFFSHWIGGFVDPRTKRDVMEKKMCKYYLLLNCISIDSLFHRQ